ncbi:MAG: MATE family efflux transporter [Candidatus Nanoarchaeia archaeon]|nr:MATE family efflux transporter [Candidatus Nanoarchaeia archaeon]
MKETKDILNGDLKKVIMNLSLPVMISNLLQSTYNITDTFWVGRLGSYAIAAVTVSFPIVFLIISLSMGIGVGGSILIAHAIGKAFKTKNEKDRKKVDIIVTQAFVVLFLMLTIISILGFIFAPNIVSLLSSDAEVYSNAVIYLRTIFIGLVLMIPYFIFEAALRAIGNTKTPMKFVFISVLINVILDPLMIFGIGPFPEMGVFGAALATVISRAIVSFIAIYHLIKNTYGIRIDFSFVKPRLKIIKELLKLGIPTSLEMSSMSLSIFVLTSLVSSLGTVTLAAFGIVTRLFSFFMIPSLGISVAVSTVVAQNFGAGNIKRMFLSLKESAKVGLPIILPISFITFIFSRYIMSAFTTDIDVINLGTAFLRIMSPFIVFGFGRHLFIGFFRGIKRTDVAMIISIVDNFVFRLAGVYILAFVFNLGAIGVWWSYPTMMIFGLILTYILYLKLKKGITAEKVKVKEVIIKSEAEKQIIG